jgi:hypothetical protein
MGKIYSHDGKKGGKVDQVINMIGNLLEITADMQLKFHGIPWNIWHIHGRISCGVETGGDSGRD